MKLFTFEIDDVYNMVSPEGVSRAFAGRVLHGDVAHGDTARLNIDGFDFILTVQSCEILRKKVSTLNAASGSCAMLVLIEPGKRFNKLQSERGLQFFRGMKIESDAK